MKCNFSITDNGIDLFDWLRKSYAGLSPAGVNAVATQLAGLRQSKDNVDKIVAALLAFGLEVVMSNNAKPWPPVQKVKKLTAIEHVNRLGNLGPLP